jgi:RimJ/RimL family protein N-acetyltransferase
MGRYELVRYEPLHAYTILDRSVRERDIWLSAYPDWDKWAEGWKKAGPAFTLLCDGQPVICGGILMMGWQRGQAWILPSTLFCKHVKQSYRLIKQKMMDIQRAYDLRRIEALVEPGFEAGKRFMEHLGFTNEGLLKRYGPRGEDMFMYGRVF